eukprot:357313-Karenia_brevis.AAC.1
MCQHNGQIWTGKKHTVESEKCPGPAIWGIPHMNRPWIVPPGKDIQWGNSKVLNIGPLGHKAQWYRGI